VKRVYDCILKSLRGMKNVSKEYFKVKDDTDNCKMEIDNYTTEVDKFKKQRSML